MAISISVLEINFIFVINNQIKSKLRRHQDTLPRERDKENQASKHSLGELESCSWQGNGKKNLKEYNCFGVAV